MTAQDLFNAIFNASLAVMVTTLVAGLGLSLTVRQILEPLRRVWVLLATVLVNSVLVEVGRAAGKRRPSSAASAPVVATLSGAAG